MMSAEYAAGFFDGEGCVNLMETGPKAKSIRPLVRVILTSTHPTILYRFQEQFGGWVNIYRPGVNRKLRYTWSQLEKKAIAFIQFIQPFSIIKREQIAVALEFWTYVQRPYREKVE